MKTLAYGTMAAGFGCLLVVACGGGVGGDPVGVGNGYDPPPITGFQPPSDGDQTAVGASSGSTTTNFPEGGTDEDAGNTSSSGTTASSTSSSGGAGCPKCDQTLTCLSGTATVPITLTTTNGACVADGETGTVTLDCNGNLVQDGTNFGTWTANGTAWVLTQTTTAGSATLTCTGTK